MAIGSRESIMTAAAELCVKIETVEAILAKVEAVRTEMLETVYAMEFGDVHDLKEKIAGGHRSWLHDPAPMVLVARRARFALVANSLKRSERFEVVPAPGVFGH